MREDRPRILLVDDAPQILRFLTHALTAAGYDCRSATTGAEALALARIDPPDLMILDLGLPDMDGKAVIEALRRETGLPIIVLSAHDQEMERILALDLGADDFVAKPFGIGELLARLRVCLRPRRGTAAPNTPPEEPRLQFGPLRIDPEARVVERDGRAVHLTRKEFDLTLLLAQNNGRVMTHRSLLERVWGPAHVEDLPYLRVFIGQLRRKLELGPDSPVQIRTEPGIGYRWLGETPPQG